MLNNKEILDGIIRNDLSIIKFLNNTFKPVVSKWIQKNNGTQDDANDMFQEAFLILFRKLNAEGDKLDLSCSFSTYFFSICKHLWFQELRSRAKYHSKGIEEFCNRLTSDSYDENEDLKFKIYLRQLNRLESKCRELLLLHCKKKSLIEIKQIMGFKNAQAVADKKKNCRKKLISNLLNCKEYKELQSEVFINY
jgi:RNA polymerase sigma factor (sigma-70 family)